jgi:hypothetical protein
VGGFHEADWEFMHIVWVPKYRYKVLKGKIGEEVRKTIVVQSERLGCEIVELESIRVRVKINSRQYLKKGISP